MNTGFQWNVYGKYHIINGCITPATYNIKSGYNPLETPNLFQQFAQMFNDIEPPRKGDIKSEGKWNRESEAAILKWVSKYGELHQFEAGIVDEKKKDILQKVSLEYYRFQVGKAHQALDHYKAFCDTKVAGYMDYKGLKAYQYTFNQFLKNAPLSNIRLGFKLEGNPPELRPLYIPDSLLSALWLQFWQTVSGQSKMGQCEWCGHLFVITHERQSYCPGDHYFSDNRSICARNHAQWLHRKKEKAMKLFEEGKSFKNVIAILSQEKHHIEATKVLEWWKEWKVRA